MRHHDAPPALKQVQTRQPPGMNDEITVQRSLVHSVLRSPGRPLDGALRADLEARMGADFGSVRLHTGAAAASSAASVGARAYTSGEHVVLGSGVSDRHTLAHELTHVIQQRQGPVSGTDHGSGLAISDPTDRFERAAEANARRVLSGAAQPQPAAGSAFSPSADSPSAPAIQRHVWVGRERVRPDQSPLQLTQPMRDLAEDDQVHHYRNAREFAAHAAGQTDYLGNVGSDEVWMRFSPTGLNVLGENHTQVTMAHVRRAVHTDNFIYELLPLDDLSPQSAAYQAFVQVNQAPLGDLGLASGAGISRHGAESIFPKMGSAFALAVPRLNVHRFQFLSNYEGSPVQRYLTVAWSYADDVQVELGQPQPQGIFVNQRREAEIRQAKQALVQAKTTTAGLLAPFVAGLTPGRRLGHELTDYRSTQGTPALIALLAALETFMQAAIPVLRTRQHRDPRLGPLERLRVQFARNDEQAFDLWRDFVFRRAVRDAKHRGVRYAGMGRNHSAFLERRLFNKIGVHFYDLRTSPYPDEDTATDFMQQKQFNDDLLRQLPPASELEFARAADPEEADSFAP